MKLKLLAIPLLPLFYSMYGMDVEQKELAIAPHAQRLVIFEKTSDGFNTVNLANHAITSLKKILDLNAQEKDKKTQQPITQIANLHLDLSSNPIQEFPEFWFPFKNLVALNLSGCNLKTIRSFLQLSGLLKLNLSHNQLEEIPEIYNNAHLEALDISHNQFKILPPLPTSIRILFAQNNQIEKLNQQFLFVLAAAHKINLSHNAISELPSLYKALQQLIRQGIPANASIESLDRFRSDFFSIDSTLVQLKQAISRRTFQQNTQLGSLILDCYDNNLKELPIELTLFEFVTKLDCGKNNLASLPAELATLKLLKYLNVSENPEMPRFIASLDPTSQLTQFFKKLHETAEEKRNNVQKRIVMYTKLLAQKQEQEKQVLPKVAVLKGSDDSFIAHSAEYFSGTKQSLTAELEKAQNESEALKREGFFL